jgi:SAM-dependent methyltransferase
MSENKDTTAKQDNTGFSSVAWEEYNTERVNSWNRNAEKRRSFFDFSKYYHKRLSEVFRSNIPAGKRVLELGSGSGDLLHSLKPSRGVGIDFSVSKVNAARSRYPELEFRLSDAHSFKSDEKFDYIILSDLINDVWDVQTILENIRQASTPDTRVVLNFYSRLWQLPLDIARKIRLIKPLLPQNWFTLHDVEALIKLSDYEIISHSSEIIFPVYIPLVSAFLNRVIAKIWPFKFASLTNFIVARPLIPQKDDGKKTVVSVVVAARNEAGNVPEIFRRIPQMADGVELIFVEGGSTDNTYEAIEKERGNYPELNCKLFRQTGVGKGDAVRLGFEKSTGDILMILDADMTVLPEVLPRFVDAIVSGKGEFINGVRLVYPMQKRAMRFFNLLGNKFFSLAFSWMLGQQIKDTLCGTKVLRKHHYEMICANRHFFGEFDPFGDFDLIFGSAKLNLKIIDLPVRYQERTYGTTNIQRWKHGALLLKMFAFGTRKMKFS